MHELLIHMHEVCEGGREAGQPESMCPECLLASIGRAGEGAPRNVDRVKYCKRKKKLAETNNFGCRTIDFVGDADDPTRCIIDLTVVAAFFLFLVVVN